MLVRIHHLIRFGRYLLLTGGLASCSTAPNRFHTGPASTGLTLLSAPGPAWNGRDTAATYATGFGGTGFLYNAGDSNQPLGAQVARYWARHHWKAGAGLLGGRGRYDLKDDLPELSYGFAGISGAACLTVYRPRTEWRLMNTQLSVVREWGALSAWRRQPYGTQYGMPFRRRTIETSLRPWQVSYALGVEARRRARRYWGLAPALGWGFLSVGPEAVPYATAALSLGPGQVAFLVAGTSDYQYRALREVSISCALGWRRPTK